MKSYQEEEDDRRAFLALEGDLALQELFEISRV
jgi:hypothetical protein